jgi:hypothetical protein
MVKGEEAAMATLRLTGTHLPKVQLRGKVIKGWEVGPHEDDPEYCQVFIAVQCDGQLYQLNRIIEQEHRQELDDQYQAIMAAGQVQAEGLINTIFWDTEEILVPPNIVPVGIGILVDRWGPAEIELPVGTGRPDFPPPEHLWR